MNVNWPYFNVSWFLLLLYSIEGFNLKTKQYCGFSMLTKNKLKIIDWPQIFIDGVNTTRIWFFCYWINFIVSDFSVGYVVDFEIGSVSTIKSGLLLKSKGGSTILFLIF